MRTVSYYITYYRFFFDSLRLKIVCTYSVIPESPTNITVMDKTQTSAMLQWSVGRITTFSRNLVHRIEYKSQWEDDIDYWHVSTLVFHCINSVHFSILRVFNHLIGLLQYFMFPSCNSIPLSAYRYPY